MILIQLFILIFLIYIIYLLSYSMFKGAPYAALSAQRIDAMMKLLNMKKGKKFCDLGSGDGRIVIAASKKGVISHGYEINPILYVISYLKLKMNKSINAKIFLSDYWKEDLSGYDYISVWGTPFMMKRLEEKLLKEVKPGAKIVSNHCKFPNWKESKTSKSVYLYMK